MRHEVFQAIVARLASDSALATSLGGAHVYRRQAGRPAQAPSITLAENTESSTTRAGYRASKVRDSTSVLQVDVWVSESEGTFPCTGEDADLIAERIDEILLDATAPISGTRGWVKTTASQQFENDTCIWHNALRYAFRYSLTDT
jgi:hypothetical protein